MKNLESFVCVAQGARNAMSFFRGVPCHGHGEAGVVHVSIAKCCQLFLERNAQPGQLSSLKTLSCIFCNRS